MIKIKELIINDVKYESIMFNINGLIKLMKIKPKLIFESLTKSIGLLRKNNNFDIYDLIKENINMYPYTNIFYIICLEDVIISTSRLIYSPEQKNAYINMVYTNQDYRGKKICQISLNKLINLTKKRFDIYELEVNPDNISAIKCYEKIGFTFVRTINYKSSKGDYYVNLMEYKNS